MAVIGTPLRPTLDLVSGWTFFRGKAGRRWLAGLEGGGEPASLPHCWNERDTFQMRRHSYSGHGAYRTVFTLPDSPNEGGRWRLRTEGFYGVGDVWLDGRRAASFDGQYLGLDVDLDRLAPGEHLLALRMDNRARRNVLPGFSAPDFLLYGGLVGRVFLERRPQAAFDPEAVTVNALVDGAGGGSVALRHELLDAQTRPHDAEIRVALFDGSGRMVAQSPPHRVGGPALETQLLLEAPRLWSPDAPNLYRAEISLEDGGRTLDAVHLHFGFVAAEFRSGRGFFLNGGHLELHGANRHESIPGFGAALPPELHRRDAEILSDFGCNFVRLSHYPQHSTFLDACDELGLLVYPEIATWKSVRPNRGWLKAARRQMRQLILRDRHRPSIILWGMGNESRSRKAYLQLGDIVRKLDGKRSTIYAENHLYRARRKKIIGMPDVWGANYELDVLKEAAGSSRSGTVVVSECCNHPASVKGDETEELTQLNTLHRDWDAMADKQFVAGYAVWCLTDYATEHRDRFRRLPGLLDAWRRPKMAAELFRARHATKPFVALFVTGKGPGRPKSRFRRDVDLGPGSSHEIHVFSNCDRVDLTIDGAKPHRLEGAVHFVLTAGAMPEALEATGISGSTTTRSDWRRHGTGHHVELKARGEASPGRTLEIDIDVVDSDGVTARGWNGHCRLALEGPARLRAFTEDREAEIARGEGRTYVTCDAVDRGEVRLTATADGLESGTALIRWALHLHPSTPTPPPPPVPQSPALPEPGRVSVPSSG